MSNAKRKRNGEAAADDVPNDAESCASEEVNEADQTYHVQVLKTKTVPQNKRRKTVDWTEVKFESDWPGDPVPYRISPGADWENLRKYKNFVVQDKNFGQGDYVFVKPPADVKDVDNLGWVGKVLEIRARDATAVFVRIFWLYWQSELPMGPQPYHGESELIMSNFMQIIDAQTVDGSVPITHIMESDRYAAPTEGYYWRQTLDTIKNRLSHLRHDCPCKRPHNPDTLLLQCPSCEKWQHEPCVVREVLRSKWTQLSTPSLTNGANGHDHLPTPNSTSDTIALTPNKTLPYRGGKKGGKGKRGKGTSAKKRALKGAAEEEWDGILEGMLERDERTLVLPEGKAPDEETTEQITGKVVVTDTRDKSGNRELVDAKCLFCSAPLKASDEGEEEEAGEIKKVHVESAKTEEDVI